MLKSEAKVALSRYSSLQVGSTPAGRPAFKASSEWLPATGVAYTTDGAAAAAAGAAGSAAAGVGLEEVGFIAAAEGVFLSATAGAAAAGAAFLEAASASRRAYDLKNMHDSS